MLAPAVHSRRPSQASANVRPGPSRPHAGRWLGGRLHPALRGRGRAHSPRCRLACGLNALHRALQMPLIPRRRAARARRMLRAGSRACAGAGRCRRRQRIVSPLECWRGDDLSWPCRARVLLVPWSRSAAPGSPARDAGRRRWPATLPCSNAAVTAGAAATATQHDAGLGLTRSRRSLGLGWRRLHGPRRAH